MPPRGSRAGSYKYPKHKYASDGEEERAPKVPKTKAKVKQAPIEDLWSLLSDDVAVHEIISKIDDPDDVPFHPRLVLQCLERGVWPWRTGRVLSLLNLKVPASSPDGYLSKVQGLVMRHVTEVQYDGSQDLRRYPVQVAHAIIGRMPNLRRLSLAYKPTLKTQQDPNFTIPGLQYPFVPNALTTLESLEIYNYPHALDAVIPLLPTTLTRLKITTCKVGALPMFQVARLANLRALELHGAERFSDPMIRIEGNNLAAIMSCCTQLETLVLDEHEGYASNISPGAFLETPTAQRLKCLDIQRQSMIRCEDLQRMLPKLNSLTKLVVPSHSAWDGGYGFSSAVATACFSSLLELRYLDLPDNLPALTYEALQGLKNLTKLEHLRLHIRDVKRDTLPLSALRLTSLVLVTTMDESDYMKDFEDLEVADLTPLSTMAGSLRDLDLSGLHTRTESIQSLSVLTALTRLSLGNEMNGFQKDAIPYLRRMRALQELEINTLLGDLSDDEFISDLTHLRSLTKLVLKDAFVGGCTFKVMAQLKRLRDVVLYKCDWRGTEDDSRALLQMTSLVSLREISMLECKKFPPKTINALIKAMPHVRFSY